MAPTPDRSGSAGRDPDEAAGERCARGGTPTALRSSLLYGKLFDEPGDRLTPSQLYMGQQATSNPRQANVQGKPTLRRSARLRPDDCFCENPDLEAIARYTKSAARCRHRTRGWYDDRRDIHCNRVERHSAFVRYPPIRMRDLIGVTFSVLLLMWASECCLAWHHTATRVEEERTCTEVSFWARPSLSVR